MSKGVKVALLFLQNSQQTEKGGNNDTDTDTEEQKKLLHFAIVTFSIAYMFNEAYKS